MPDAKLSPLNYSRNRLPEPAACPGALRSALQARFEASLEAFQARFAALHARFEASLYTVLHALARAFRARMYGRARPSRDGRGQVHNKLLHFRAWRPRGSQGALGGCRNGLRPAEFAPRVPWAAVSGVSGPSSALKASPLVASAPLICAADPPCCCPARSGGGETGSDLQNSCPACRGRPFRAFQGRVRS